ncbi:MAG TPA: MBL fold metallo-hydrolase, partial [Calditrichaeota bacterium]|nr:MBL fold metallo-hydrolase [Calditrichota bacterium]
PNLVELDVNPFSWSGLVIRHWANGHTSKSVSYRFEEKGNSVFFSGDCGYSEELVRFAQNVKLAFIECSYPDENPQEGHLTPKKTALLAEKAGFKQLVLIHIYPENDTPDLAGRVEKYFSGKVVVGKDYLKLDSDEIWQQRLT